MLSVIIYRENSIHLKTWTWTWTEFEEANNNNNNNNYYYYYYNSNDIINNRRINLEMWEVGSHLINISRNVHAESWLKRMGVFVDY
jgi:hypothetical protein